MGIPDLQSFRQVREKRAEAVFDAQGAFAEFTFKSRLDLSSKKIGHDLKSIANAQDRDSEFKDSGLWQRGFFGVYTSGSAGQNNAFWPERRNFSGGRGVAQNNRIDIALTNSASDDLGILRSEIENDDLLYHWQ